METMGKVTMYLRSEFGMGVVKVEAKTCELEVKPYAQYERGIYVKFLKPRQRKTRSLVQASYPSLVILDGWGHPDPDGMFLPEQPGETEGVTVRHGRYSAFDERWAIGLRRQARRLPSREGVQASPPRLPAPPARDARVRFARLQLFILRK